MFRDYYALNDNKVINAYYNNPSKYSFKFFEFMNLRLSSKNKILDKMLASSTIFLHYNSAIKVNEIYKLRLMTEKLVDGGPYRAQKRKVKEDRDQEASELKELFKERRRRERDLAEVQRRK